MIDGAITIGALERAAALEIGEQGGRWECLLSRGLHL